MQLILRLGYLKQRVKVSIIIIDPHLACDYLASVMTELIFWSNQSSFKKHPTCTHRTLVLVVFCKTLTVLLCHLLLVLNLF